MYAPQIEYGRRRDGRTNHGWRAMSTGCRPTKASSWGIFWFGWFYISPTTIIPGAIAVGVGNVIYRERALNLVTVCAVYLGVLAYLALGTSSKHCQSRPTCGWASPASSRWSCSVSATQRSACS